MTVDISLIQQHIAHWRERLSQTEYKYRTLWPEYLFRHEPVQNAAQILLSGRLLSRHQSEGVRHFDIAAEDVLNNRLDAHKFSRLYFRPKNPTQYHIEGIRKPSELYRNNPKYHAPVLVLLLFRSTHVLTMPGVFCSDGNMQSPQTDLSPEENFFRSLDFSKIYHMGPIDSYSDRDIIRSRCAEVLVPSPLDLSESLAGVVCRSHAERRTLMHLLGPEKEKWANKIRIFKNPGLFENRFAYVDSVNIHDNKLVLAIHGREDGKPVLTRCYVEDDDGRVVVNGVEKELDPKHRWGFAKSFSVGDYKVTVELERCLAYQAISRIDTSPF